MKWKDIPVINFYVWLSYTGIDKDTPEKLKKHILLANSINLTTLTLIPPYAILFYFLGLGALAILLYSFFFLFCFYLYLTHRKRYFLSRTLMVISMNLILGIYAIMLGKDAGMHFLYFVFFTLPFLLYDFKNYLLIAFCCLSSIVPFCIVRFEIIKPVIIMDSLSLEIISGAMVLITFIWLMLNKFYLLNTTRLVEEDLKKSNQSLQLRNRDLEQFAYVASHDLQEPLRNIASYVELLDRQYSHHFDENARLYMSHAITATHRLKKLIQDLLVYSRIGRNFKSEKLNISEIVKDVNTSMHALISESKATVIHPVLPQATGHIGDLKFLFQNLISNAIKFRKENELPVIKITAEQNGGFWKFAVNDNGIGIESEYFDRIFVIFQRLHGQHEYGGNGIGLAHCKKIVEMHGGNIWVESEYGKGSSFYFTLPS
ncbi:MAG: ATP-binding protein [Bacteroidota bacterium]